MRSATLRNIAVESNLKSSFYGGEIREQIVVGSPMLSSREAFRKALISGGHFGHGTEEILKHFSSVNKKRSRREVVFLPLSSIGLRYKINFPGLVDKAMESGLLPCERDTAPSTCVQHSRLEFIARLKKIGVRKIHVIEWQVFNGSDFKFRKPEIDISPKKENFPERLVLKSSVITKRDEFNPRDFVLLERT